MLKQFPLITAHSGCMNTPDNSLLSVETGLKLGADVIEEDIRVTGDDVPVLAHEDQVHTAGGKKYRISQLNYEDLKDLLFEEKGQIKKIYRLEEMLSLIQASGKMANLDLKVDECIGAVASLVKRYDLLDRVILSGCETERATMVQMNHPELRKLLNADGRLFVSSDYFDAVTKTCEDALAASCFGINIDHRLIRLELLEYAGSRNLPVLAWTVNDEGQMKRFADMGVYSITTRNVSALIKLKQETMNS